MCMCVRVVSAFDFTHAKSKENEKLLSIQHLLFSSSLVLTENYQVILPIKLYHQKYMITSFTQTPIKGKHCAKQNKNVFFL